MVGIGDFIRKMKKSWKQNEISTYASSLAFFLFLSFLPLLLFISSLLPYTPVTAGEFTVFLEKLLPIGRGEWVQSLVKQVYHKAPGILSLSFFLSWWSLGKGMLALMRAFNRIYERKENRGYVRLRIVASIYTLIFILLLLFTLCFGVFGRLFFQLLLQNMASYREILLLLEKIRELVILLFLLVFFLGIYTLIPEKRRKIRSQFKGAVAATFFWVLFSYGFSLYVKELRPFTGYGTLGTVLVFLLWLYFCSCIVLMGAIVNIIDRNKWKY